MANEDESRDRLMKLLSPEATGRVLAGELRAEPTFSVQELAVVCAGLSGYRDYCTEHAATRVATTLSGLLPRLIECVLDHGGLVDKLVGGGIVALFGVPKPSPHAARDALRAAREICRRAPEASAGVHVGEAAAGFFGSERMLAYTAVGDVINVAFGLEEVAERRRASLVVSDAVKRLSGEATDAVSLGAISLSGRKGDVEAWSLG